MKKIELRQIIKEEILKESRANWQSLVSKVGTACEWDYDETVDFIEALLIDSNFHTEAKRVVNFMNKISVDKIKQQLRGH